MSNIKSVKPIGKHRVYDLEVKHLDHQYYLSNGVLTSNSHAIFYSMIGYHTAYLKAHFPLEFLVSNLMSEINSNSLGAKDNITRIKEEIRQLNVAILPPDINTSSTTYTIVDDNTLMTGMDALKNMGKDAIPEILPKRPFSGFEDFIAKVDGRKVRAPAIQALAASGSLDSFNLTRKQMYLYASDIKKKIQVHMKKPEDKRGEFKYPWPEDIGEWSVTELYAMEREYLGEGLTGNKFEVYDNFFTKKAPSFKKMPNIHPPPPDDMSERDQRKYTKHVTMMQAEVKNFFEFKVKKEDSKIRGEVMAKVTLSDPWGNQMTMTCFPDGWLHLQNRVAELLNNKYKFDTGIGLYINGELNWYDGDISLIFGDVARCCPAPQLPVDRESKKVMVRRPRKKTKVEDADRDVLLEEIEDELVERGHADLDDDDDVQDGFV